MNGQQKQPGLWFYLLFALAFVYWQYTLPVAIAGAVAYAVLEGTRPTWWLRVRGRELPPPKQTQYIEGECEDVEYADIEDSPPEDPIHAALADPLVPRGFDEIIGQARAKKMLKLMIRAAEMREGRIEHILFTGPGGTGKTALAKALAQEVKAQFVFSTASNLNRFKPDKGVDPLAEALIESVQFRNTGEFAYGLLFIDEIHRLDHGQWERLYSLLEGGIFEVMGTTYPVNDVAIIGATTDPHMLNQSVLTRFRRVELEPYTKAEMKAIIEQGARKLGVEMTCDAADLLADNARGNPRLSLNTFTRLSREVAMGDARELVEHQDALDALDLAGVVNLEDGMMRQELRYLRFLVNVGGGPAGVKAVSAGTGENSQNIEAVIEPFLIQRHYIMRTPRGRVITDKGREVYEAIELALQRE